MPTGTPNVPLDSNGKPLAGRALEYHLRKQAELDAAAGYAEDIRAGFKILCLLASHGMSMPAPDALAALGAQAGPDGQQAALRTLRAAGFDPDPVAQRWAEERPLQRQSSSRAGDIYADDPLHDPRVTEAALRHGGSFAETSDIGIEVTRERRQERQEQRAAAGQPPGFMWQTQRGEALRDGTTPEAPVQRSVVRRDVPELGSETVPPAPPFTWGA